MSESKPVESLRLESPLPNTEALEKLSKEELIQVVLSLANSKTGGVSPDNHHDEWPFTPSSVMSDFVRPNKILLDGNCLTPEELVAIGYDPSIYVDLAPAAWNRVAVSRKIVDNIIVCNLKQTRNATVSLGS